MKRKLKAIWRILTCEAYSLCVVNRKSAAYPFYDHTMCADDVIFYNGFIVDYYREEKNGQEAALDEAKQILGI